MDGPFGAFTLDRYDTPGFVFIAGGIGITPVMSMLRALVTRGDRRPLQLIYANKTWDEVTYREELPGFEAGLDLDILHVLEEPPDDWDGGTGFVTKDLLDEHLPKGPLTQPAPVFPLRPACHDRRRQRCANRAGHPARTHRIRRIRAGVAMRFIAESIAIVVVSAVAVAAVVVFGLLRG